MNSTMVPPPLPYQMVPTKCTAALSRVGALVLGQMEVHLGKLSWAISRHGKCLIIEEGSEGCRGESTTLLLHHPGFYPDAVRQSKLERKRNPFVRLC